MAWGKEMVQVKQCTKTKAFNPLNANPTKWSNTLKQFIEKSQKIVSVCLTILWGWRLKGYQNKFFLSPIFEAL